jgi:hypothetical protein
VRIETVEQRQQREREIANRRIVIETLVNTIHKASASVTRLLAEIKELERV